MSVSVFSHPWLSGLFGDDQVGDLLSAETELANMLRVEQAFSRALGAAGIVSVATAEAAAAAIAGSHIDVTSLKAGAARDGMAVPDMVRQLKAQTAAELHPAIHKGLTSQDVIDTALVLALRDILVLFEQRLQALQVDFGVLSDAFGDRELMGRTRMQAAVPITAADRIATWALPLGDHLQRLSELRPRLLKLQLGGAAGNNAALGDKADAVAQSMASELDLVVPDRSWHAMRDGLGEFGSWLSLVTGTLGKLGQDVCLMAQQGIDDIHLTGGGGSSAMPHKQNPVLAELLVALARYNAGQVGALHQALVHEQERSGAAWALEWMVLPQMVLATARALIAAQTLVTSVDRIGSA